jgi:Mg-chelatase subunit ChlD
VFTWPEPFPTRVERCQAPADIALLMDTSGSMNDDDITPPQPITDAKNAAISFVNRMTSSDRISIITFATRAEHKQKLVENLVVAQNSISSISILPEEENGFTNIGEAIMLASAELIEGANNRGSASSAELERSIILLTDGRANQPTDPGGEIYAFEQARIARAQGIKIFTIGLGEKVNKDFLLEMASDAESNFFAVTSRELTEIYKKISESICERGPAIVDIIPLSRDMLSPF